MMDALEQYQNTVLTEETVAKARSKNADTLQRQRESVEKRVSKRELQKGISGLVFAVSGELRSYSSAARLKAQLKMFGASLSSAVSVKTDYLIATDLLEQSQPVQKANELGVEIIDETRLRQMIAEVEEIIIPAGSTKIETETFEQCTGLKKVVIPEGVTYIGERAFYGCTSLTDISLPDSIIQIGEEAFGKYASLVKVSIPAGVKKISSYAFYGSTSLTNVVFHGKETSFPLGTFSSGCQNLVITALIGSNAEACAMRYGVRFEDL